MNSRGKKIFRDESRYAFIRIHLGIQPSTAASHRCRAEIQKDGSLLCPRVFQYLIHIVTPLNFHELALCEACSPTLQFIRQHSSHGLAPRTNGSFRRAQSSYEPSYSFVVYPSALDIM